MTSRPWWGPLVILTAVSSTVAVGSASVAPTHDDAAFLTRVTYGARPRELAELARAGRAAWIAAQLHPTVSPDLAGRLAAWPTLSMRPGELKERYPYRPPGNDAGDRDARRAVRKDMKEAQRTPLHERAAARVTRAVHSDAQFQEMVATFWLDHFNVYPRKTPAMGWLIGDFEDEAVRPHLFGTFRTLLGAVAHAPAMLVYLDNERSAVADADAGHPGINENYARELLELHTLGVDGGYTQGDVEAVARIFTGWGVVMEEKGDARPGTFRFRTRWHDWGQKTVLGTRFPPEGEAEGERLLDLLAAHPATVRRLSTKLCRSFVGAPSTAMVDRVSARWEQTGGDLRAVYEALLTDPDLLVGLAARSPLQWLAAALRAAPEADFPAEDAARLIDDMGQDVLGALPPTGYDDNDWLTADALVRRMTTGRDVGGRLAPALRAEGVTTAAQLVTRFLPTRLDDGALADRLGADPDVGVLTGRILGSPEFQRR